MSTATEKKRPSLTEHFDDQIIENNQELKSTDEIATDEIHTANDWEHADLGDEQRKQKFLRLMGVKKRKDEDLSSEKKHCRTQAQLESINRELEKQFNEGLQSKILHTHHEGLGFHSDASSTPAQNQTQFVPATTSANQQ